MSAEHYHLVVVGGGINGVGVAQAAAAAGYRTMLLEKNPRLGLETSSRSSKLIHGGLRYLESFELALVREALQERSLLLKLAPDLVRMQRFNIPLYSHTNRSALTLHAGLSLYALLAGLKTQHRYRQIRQRDWGQLEGLNTKQLKTVFQYQDAQTDDVALTHAVAASAARLGAEIICDSELISAQVGPDQVEIEYQTGLHTKHIRCEVMVNATGPWLQSVTKRVQPHPVMVKPDLVQGAHLVMNHAAKQAFYLEAPQDGRAVFLLPWKGHALLGTTEHLYKGDPSQVRPLSEEQGYLLEVYHHYFPDHDQSVLEAFAGCRVLQGGESKLFKRSRETSFIVDSSQHPRVVSISGGKLTVYRRTAQKVMGMVARSLPEKKAIADTAELGL